MHSFPLKPKAASESLLSWCFGHPPTINERQMQGKTYSLFLLCSYFGAFCKQYYITRKKKEPSQKTKKPKKPTDFNFRKIHHKRQNHSHGIITKPQVTLRHSQNLSKNGKRKIAKPQARWGLLAVPCWQLEWNKRVSMLFWLQKLSSVSCYPGVLSLKCVFFHL